MELVSVTRLPAVPVRLRLVMVCVLLAGIVSVFGPETFSVPNVLPFALNIMAPDPPPTIVIVPNALLAPPPVVTDLLEADVSVMITVADA